MNQPASTNQPGPMTSGDVKKIMIGVVAILLLGVALPMFIFYYPEYQRDQLIKNGVAADGEIVSIAPTGNIYNDQPQADVVVRITTENGETFESKTRMIINPLYAPQFQPGKKVKVRYDANDRDKMAIEATVISQ